MLGPQILVWGLSLPGPLDRWWNRWQDRSRSDRHSKAACWGVALDVLRTSALLRRHAGDGKVVLRINHEMTDSATNRRRRLDLVVAGRRRSVGQPEPDSATLAQRYGVDLSDRTRCHKHARPGAVAHERRP